MKEFIDGKFFDGELYVDIGKKSYAALKFKKYNYLSIIPALIARVAREAYSKSKSMGIKGNMDGDGFQTGGLLVVSPRGEKVIFEFRQENPADHPQNEDILKALNLESRSGAGGRSTQPTARGVECNEDACSKPY